MENTEEIYTDFARVYDELMDNTPYEMWCNRLDQLIASYGVSRPTRDAEGILDSERNLVVDLGCGTGTLTELLYQKGYDCIGVDNSEEMLGIAMEKKAERGHDWLPGLLRVSGGPPGGSSPQRLCHSLHRAGLRENAPPWKPWFPGRCIFDRGRQRDAKLCYVYYDSEAAKSGDFG